MKKKKGSKAFSLMEIIVAIGVIMTFLVGAITLISYSITGIRIGKSRIIAMALAQEGLEIVRNIRDNNWLNNKREATNWRDGLGSGHYRVQYDQTNLFSPSSDRLKVDSKGFYYYEDQGYRSGSVTVSFRRDINIEYIPGDDSQIKITSTITWEESGRNYTFSTETRLFNWLEPE